jgi:hypothetical protein
VKELLTLKADLPTARGSRSEMERLVMHLDAASRLARWLLRDEAEAEDCGARGVSACIQKLPEPSRARQPGVAADDCT